MLRNFQNTGCAAASRSSRSAAVRFEGAPSVRNSTSTGEVGPAGVVGHPEAPAHLSHRARVVGRAEAPPGPQPVDAAAVVVEGELPGVPGLGAQEEDVDGAVVVELRGERSRSASACTGPEAYVARIDPLWSRHRATFAACPSRSCLLRPNCAFFASDTSSGACCSIVVNDTATGHLHPDRSGSVPHPRVTVRRQRGVVLAVHRCGPRRSRAPPDRHGAEGGAEPGGRHVAVDGLDVAERPDPVGLVPDADVAGARRPRG